LLQRMVGAVDLDRTELPAGPFELALLRQPLGIERALAPLGVDPTADARANHAAPFSQREPNLAVRHFAPDGSVGRSFAWPSRLFGTTRSLLIATARSWWKATTTSLARTSTLRCSSGAPRPANARGRAPRITIRSRSTVPATRMPPGITPIPSRRPQPYVTGLPSGTASK